MKANYTVLSLLAILIFNSGLQAQSTTDTTGEHDRIFPLGEKAPSNNFNGTVWVKPLVPNDSVLNCEIGSVTFEPVQEATGIIIRPDKYCLLQQEPVTIRKKDNQSGYFVKVML